MKLLNVYGYMSPEAEVVEEILRCPELGYEGKGTRMKAIFMCLWDLYKTNPEAPASERFIADAVYSGMGDEDDSIVRRAVMRLRRFLDRISNERLSNHCVRVRIPLRQYKLEFYNPFFVDGLRPMQWFWNSYFDPSSPPVFVLFQPTRKNISIPSALSKEVAERFAGALRREVHQFCLPDLQTHGYMHEPDKYRPFSSLEVRFVVSEKHGMMLGSYPAKVDAEYECEVLRRQSIALVGGENNPIANTLPAISYAKITRFTNADPPKQQLTLLDAEWGFPIKRLVEYLTLDECLLPFLTRPGFKSKEVQSAPRKFQMLFSSVRNPGANNGRAESECEFPILRAVTLGPEYIYLGLPAQPWHHVETRAL